MHNLLLGRPRGHDEDSAVLEVRYIAHLRPFPNGDRAVVLPADDQILERAIQFFRELDVDLCTCMSSSP